MTQKAPLPATRYAGGAPERWGCYGTEPIAHPWEPSITDLACGFLAKATDAGCAGCWRNRDDWPGNQLVAQGHRVHPQARR